MVTVLTFKKIYFRYSPDRILFSSILFFFFIVFFFFFFYVFLYEFQILFNITQEFWCYCITMYSVRLTNDFLLSNSSVRSVYQGLKFLLLNLSFSLILPMNYFQCICFILLCKLSTKKIVKK